MNILPRSQFLNLLRLEKRRVDRSKAPLSIALFNFRNGMPKDNKTMGNFLMSLNRNTRETDIKGWVDLGVIGVILPDTDEKGALRCVQKIQNGNANSGYSAVTGTYPHDLFQELLVKKEEISEMFPINLEERPKPRTVELVLKRGIDVAGSIAGLLIFSPFMLLTAIAVKVNSRGPVLFKQLRLGMRGRRFPFYKFRSMFMNGDDRIHREYVTHLIKGDLDKINNGDKESPLYKMKNDPRITPVGKIIRKTSVDELPQFINVLRGEMSLVGPRPPLPYEVEKYEPWHLRRILEVKPGITGLWQVNGRSKTSFDEMVRLDLRYVENWSVWLDIEILIKTVKTVLRPSGAA